MLSPNAFLKKKNKYERTERRRLKERKKEKKKYSLEKQTELEEFSKGAIKNANQLREHET